MEQIKKDKEYFSNLTQVKRFITECEQKEHYQDKRKVRF